MWRYDVTGLQRVNIIVVIISESNSASVDDVSAKQPKIDNDDDDLGSDPELELGNFEEIKTTSTPAPVTAKHQPIEWVLQAEKMNVFVNKVCFIVWIVYQ